MGLPSGEPVHARNRDGTRRGDDPREAAPQQGRPRRHGPRLSLFVRALIVGLALALACFSLARADTLRIATYNVELSRKGPGLLLRDITRGKDAQVAAIAKVIVRTHPDLLLLTGIDYDRHLAALSALRNRLKAAGLDYPYLFAYPPNTGQPTGTDIDGDGSSYGPRDAQGYGRFPGQGGMALLSRLPIDRKKSRDLSGFLWRDLPGALIDGARLSPRAQERLRLSNTGHWDVVVTLPDGVALHLLAYAATPPVFDGPEDRNGRRNHDETAFWRAYLDGRLPFAPPGGAFVILGDANLDPADSDGRADALNALRSDPRLQDPVPRSRGGADAADPGQNGDPTRDTADWKPAPGPGNLRVDYVLPSAGLKVTGAGVYWPATGSAGGKEAARASHHRLVWVDISLP